jgi:hypothetical protein
MHRAYIGAHIGSAMALLACGGCGGASFSTEIRVPLEQRHALTPIGLSADQVRLPGDRTFNIHLKSSSQDPGAQGSARGDSDAANDGQAFASAQAAAGGIAEARFVLGHRLDNESDRTLSAAVQVEFELEQEIRAPREPASKTVATAYLNLTILDARKRPLTNIPVVQATSDQAVGASITTCRYNLSALFEPQQSYNVLLQGNVRSETAPGQQADARLKVRNLRMLLTFAPAPPESAPADAAATSRPAAP